VTRCVFLCFYFFSLHGDMVIGVVWKRLALASFPSLDVGGVVDGSEAVRYGAVQRGAVR
jgi:hypothetical protein